MAKPTTTPTGRERTFRDDEIIVSKTDLKGIIRYANQVFVRISGFSEEELLGAPHNIIRHPDMPGCVFKLLWDTISAGNEIFAYVINLCKNGDHYWVYAHVTPSFDAAGNIIGYHSSRRTADANAVRQVASLYAELRGIEQQHSDYRAGMKAAGEALCQRLEQAGISYPEFVCTL